MDTFCILVEGQTVTIASPTILKQPPLAIKLSIHIGNTYPNSSSYIPKYTIMCESLFSFQTLLLWVWVTWRSWLWGDHELIGHRVPLPKKQ